MSELHRIGLVVHPTRSLDTALDAIRGWAGEREVEVVQVKVEGQERQVAEERDAADCDLIAAVGGDGTMLAALGAALTAERPVLGIACGSLGVLTTVTAEDAKDALDRFADGDWFESRIPALEARSDGADPLLALNDIAMTRKGQGQLTTCAEVDGTLYARFVGDGFVVTTPLGSSGYTLAAGGPLLAPGANTFALTPLAKHGGCVPPLVVGAESELEIDIVPGYGGVRLELDGRPSELEPEALKISLRAHAVTVVALENQEPILTGLRRKKILMDSPRVLAREARGDDD